MLQPIKFQQLLIALILASVLVFFIYRERTPQFAKNSLVFWIRSTNILHALSAVTLIS